MGIWSVRVSLTASLLSGVSLLVLSAPSAHADCTIETDATVTIDCRGRGFAEIEVNLQNSTISIDQLSGTISVPDNPNISHVFNLNGQFFNVYPETTGSRRSWGRLQFPDSDDRVYLNRGFLMGDIYSTGGDDIIEISGAQVEGSIHTDGAVDFTISDGWMDGSIGRVVIEEGDPNYGTHGTYDIHVEGGAFYGDFFLPSKNDKVEISDGYMYGSILSDGMVDVTISGGFMDGQIGGALYIVDPFFNRGEILFGEYGQYNINIDGGLLDGSIYAGLHDDNINISGGQINGEVSGHTGDDIINISGGQLYGSVFGGGGNDIITVSGGQIGDEFDVRGITGNEGDDTITIGPDGVVFGPVLGGVGDDTINISGSLAPVPIEYYDVIVYGESGNDSITLSSTATVGGDVTGGDGNDIIVSSGTVDGNIDGGTGNDEITMTGGSVDRINGGHGNDTIVLSGGHVTEVSGASGDDVVSVLGGTFQRVQGGGGHDALTLGGGAFLGPIDESGERQDASINQFESVLIDPTLSDDAITGSASIVGRNTTYGPANIEINNVAPGALDDAELKIGWFDTGTINNSVFDVHRSIVDGFGIRDLTLNNSQLNFSEGVTYQANGLGSLVANNSSLNLINNSAGDAFVVGSAAINNSSLGVDVDPGDGTSDALVVTNGTSAFAASGSNVIYVNFTAPVDPTVEQEVSIIEFGDPQETLGETVNAAPAEGSGSVYDTFSVSVVGEYDSPLFDATLVAGPDGTLMLATTPETTITPAPAAVNAVQAAFASDTVSDINNDLADVLTRFQSAAGAGRVAVTPQFGIYANGSYGYTDHDGFDVSAGGLSLTTPAFDANSFSLVGVGEVDASAEFGLADNDIGLRLSAFGGYVENEVTFSRNDGAGGITPFRGEGTNTGGVVGGTALASKLQGAGNLNYGLISGAFFFGDTDVTNAATGGTGSYGTTGYVLSGKLGRNMAVADRLRLDLRVGASYQAFRGGSFTDTTGVAFGSSEVGYGLLSFEPGISTSVAVGDLIVSPSARAIFQARVGDDNSATIQGVNFDFDDGNLLLGGQLGAATRFSDRLSGGVFVEGRLTEDSRSLLGKLSLKYTIPKT